MPRRHRNRFVRLGLEPLECRTVPATFTLSNSVPVAVVDQATVRSDIVVSDPGILRDLNVSLNLTHQSAADLHVALVAPDGRRITLFFGDEPDDNVIFLGVTAVNYDNTFDDEASTSIVQSTLHPTGTFRPRDPLATFDGINPSGTWSLEVTDTSAGHTGTIDSWSLTATVTDPVELVGINFNASTRVVWGETTTVSYTIQNTGHTDAGPFSFEVRLSTDATIDGSDTVVGTGTVTGIVAGSSFVGSMTVTLPIGFAGLTEAYLGLVIDSNGDIVEGDETNNLGSRVTFDLDRFIAITPLTETESNDTQATANALASPFRLDATLTAGDVDYFQIDATTAGRYVVRLDSADADIVAELSTPAGELLVRSEPRPGELVFDQHLTTGFYFLKITSRTGALPIAYRLSGELAPALTPDAPIDSDFRYIDVKSADLDGDGLRDLVALRQDDQGLAILLGNGDGSFRPGQVIATVGSPTAFALADFDGDGRLDLVLANSFNGAGVHFGNGDGSFQAERRIDVFANVSSVAADDVNGDDRIDLLLVATGFNDTRSITFLLNNGDGSFGTPRILQSGFYPSDITTADLNGDGFTDLFLTIPDSQSVGVSLGNGDGTFQPQQFHNAGDPSPTVTIGGLGPISITAADINGDGRLDLITANNSSNDLSVLLGNGDGTFQDEYRLVTGQSAYAVEAADVNGDGNVDLLVSSWFSGKASVLLGNGDGSFQSALNFAVGADPVALAVADFTGDGRLDLVTANALGSTGLSILPGNGDGSFQTRPRSNVGNTPTAVASGDLNGDGRMDVVVTNANDNNVSVLLGNGDGSFAAERRYITGNSTSNGFGLLTGPIQVLVVDVNGDGRLDLLTLNQGSADFLAILSDVSVLLGNGDGTFQSQRRFTVGNGASSMSLRDVDGDGRLDLLIALNGSQILFGDTTLSILRGNGDGTFQTAISAPAGPELFGFLPTTLDVSGDGRDDRINAGLDGQSITIELANADGTFQPAQNYATGFVGGGFAVADVDGDGTDDLIVTDGDYRVHVLRGIGDGTFRLGTTFLAQIAIPTTISVDLNGDGRLDLASINQLAETLDVSLGNPDSTFTPLTQSQVTPVRHVPFLADLDGDGRQDTAVLDDRGRILFRRGTVGVNLYQPPIVVNSVLARDLTVIRTAAGFALAAADVTGDRVSLYQFSNGAFTRTTIATGQTPTRLASADLDGDGLGDLVAVSPTTNSVRILRQQIGGTFDTGLDRDINSSPVDVSFADVDGQSGLDIVITGRASGDVAVLFNDTGHTFAQWTRYRSGLGFSTFAVVDNQLQTSSLELPISSVTGDFTGDGIADLIEVTREARQIRLLEGTGTGYRNTTEPFRLAPTGELAPALLGQIRAADLDHDGDLDLLIVMEDRDQVWIYLNDGGLFDLHSRVSAGQVPTGLSVAQLNDDNGDGQFDALDHADLLIGNGFGDVLSVLGNGDGSFRPFVRADQRVPLALADLDGDGDLDVVMSEQARDRAATQTREGVVADPPNGFQRTAGAFTQGGFERDSSGGLIGPGDVAIADVDGLNGADLVFANTGSNNVLVFLRQVDGSFGDTAVSFFTGTSPIALHAAQLNDDNEDGQIDSLDLLDLVVANQGSNDISVLLGNRDRDVNGDGAMDLRDLFAAGLRLASNGSGPNAVTTRDVTGDGIPDILATNGQSGTLATIAGVGNLAGLGTGAFDSTSAMQFALVPPQPGQPGVTQPVVQTEIVNSTLAIALTQDGDLIRFNPTTGTTAVVFAPVFGREITTFDFVTTSQGTTLLFTANGDGSISLLAEDGAGMREAFSGSAGLIAPSALEVLERADGVFELYLTESGESRPVLLTLDLRAELSPGGTGDTGGTDPFTPTIVLVTDVSVPGGDAGADSPSSDSPPTEVFVDLRSEAATLESVSLDGDTVSSSGQQLIAFVLDTEAVSLNGSGDQQEEETIEEAPEDDESAEQRLEAFMLGLKEELERLSKSDEMSEKDAPETEEPKQSGEESVQPEDEPTEQDGDTLETRSLGETVEPGGVAVCEWETSQELPFGALLFVGATLWRGRAEERGRKVRREDSHGREREPIRSRFPSGC